MFNNVFKIFNHIHIYLNITHKELSKSNNNIIIIIENRVYKSNTTVIFFIVVSIFYLYCLMGRGGVGSRHSRTFIVSIHMKFPLIFNSINLKSRPKLERPLIPFFSLCSLNKRISQRKTVTGEEKFYG